MIEDIQCFSYLLLQIMPVQHLTFSPASEQGNVIGFGVSIYIYMCVQTGH